MRSFLENHPALARVVRPRRLTPEQAALLGEPRADRGCDDTCSEPGASWWAGWGNRWPSSA